MNDSTEYKTYTKSSTIRIKKDLTHKSSSKSSVKPNNKTIKDELNKRWNNLPLSSRKLYAH